MDLISPSIVDITIFLLSSLLIIFVYIQKSRPRANTLPPGNKGWPIVGESVEFGRASTSGEPEKFINDRTSKYSPDVFRTSLLGEDVAVFCGELGNKLLLCNANKFLKPWYPPTLVKAMTSKTNIRSPIRFEQVTTKFKSVLRELLKPNFVQKYIPIMDSMTREHLETNWLPYQQLKALPLVKNFALALACRLFLNIKDPNNIILIEQPFTALIDGILSVPINFPGTPYRRALKASKIIHDNLFSIIKKRKLELSKSCSEESAAPDILTRALLMSDENGRAIFNEKEMSTVILALLFASHDTVTSAITFVLKYLGENPHVYKEVLKEQMEIANSKGPQELLNWDDIQKMKYSWCVACESMRLSPASQGNFREVTTDFTYQGFTIPKGWKAYWTVHTTNKNPKYFQDPEKFDPSRFQGDGPAPNTFLPFGKGPHMCLGKEYARVSILTFMHNMVTRFKWETMIPDEKTMYTVSAIPVEGLPIQMEAHNN